MPVLLLNGTYEPLRVVTMRRALTLVISGKAEPVDSGTHTIRSAGGHEFTVPTVIRLRYVVRVPYQARAPLSRRALRARDGGRCQVAGCERAGSTVDHVVPRSRGGAPRSWENVVLMCAQHNARKGDRLLSELGWRLKHPPHAPNGSMLLLAAAGASPVPEWEPWLGLGA